MRHFFRMFLVALLLLNAALILVFVETASLRMRYTSVDRQEQRNNLALEHRALMRQVAECRQPDRLREKAELLGIHVRSARHEDVLVLDGGGNEIVLDN